MRVYTKFSIVSMTALLSIITAFVLLAGCGVKKDAPGDFGFFGGEKEEMGYEEDAGGPEAVTREAPSEMPAKKAETSASGAQGAEMSDQLSEPGTAEGATVVPTERMRIYSGYCKLQVDSVEKKRDQIFTIAETTGGYVESTYGSTIIIRVPAENFTGIFNTILDLGTVVRKSVETYDITEYFQDLSTRLKIAEKTRSRLYTLLEKTDNVNERLKILREISRLTDEIERIRQSLELMEQQVKFSRITIELISKLDQKTEEKLKIPFGWISNLDPIYASLPDLRGSIDLELGDDFAVFEKDKAFRAESAEGTRVRVGSIRNNPSGDQSFWQNALDYHLKDFYRESRKMDQGEVKSVIFTSKDREPYYYLVGVTVNEKYLYVIEVFFPDRTAFDRRIEGIKKSIEGIKIR
jgi:hypothetical protein